MQKLMHYLISEISFYEMLQHSVTYLVKNKKLYILLFYLYVLRQNFNLLKQKYGYRYKSVNEKFTKFTSNVAYCP